MLLFLPVSLPLTIIFRHILFDPLAGFVYSIFHIPINKETPIILFQDDKVFLHGSQGQLEVPSSDELLLKFAMIFEGECEGLGKRAAAEKYGYSKQRYFQLRTLLQHQGILALQSHKRGPRTNYRRTEEVVRQVIRHRFLDPDASAQVIAQKLNQAGWPISIRSVERIIGEYGLQKKTPHVSSSLLSL